MKYPQPSVSNPPAARRILIVRLSAHGDVTHTLPLLAALKRQYPNAFVGWLVEASAAPLLENHPLIDRLHVSHRKRWLSCLAKPAQWPSLWQEVEAFVRELRAEGYQLSFDVQGLLKSAIWPWLAKIPLRYGFKATRESADWFYNHRLPPMSIRDAQTPAVQRYLDFARAIGCQVEAPEFILPPLPAQTAAKVEVLLSLLPLPSQPLVVLASFTRWPSKHWPMGHWAQLLPLLLELNVSVVLLGAASDAPRATTILGEHAGSPQVLNLVGQTDWPDLYALFQRAHLLIGLDSAPLHIADAVGGPKIIGLYGPTAPGRTGPVGGQHTILTAQLDCQPCFERDCPLKTTACMSQLTPQQVLQQVRKALGLAASSAPLTQEPWA
ncbi:lipopolysaccharide heptosyltransferase II [Vampirovibrio chlorellavorus]|uniref:lipopolysaccharide heptosyltransferase II n=1 Tax=Vampirovibrio chlorellavorus TaxID=758823 RepID=UPI0026F12514|nr:lipopolysaccharide heptosyltransferase II [Vampirovibrio chlorellavorus]